MAKDMGEMSLKGVSDLFEEGKDGTPHRFVDEVLHARACGQGDWYSCLRLDTSHYQHLYTYTKREGIGNSSPSL